MLQGNILEASRWTITKTLRGAVDFIGDTFKSKPVLNSETSSIAMKALGKSIAARIVTDEKDTEKAAAILLLAALDMAYISVLAVSFRCRLLAGYLHF